MKWKIKSLVSLYTFILADNDYVEIKLSASSLIGAKFRMCLLLGKTEGIDIEFE